MILAHGLSADGSAMVGRADHYASWGLTVVVPDLYHSGIVGTDHDKNVTELHALADRYAPDGVIYSGHSFGALESVLAASTDPKSRAVVGLDLADDNNAGEDRVPSLTVPLRGLIGEPEWCNEANSSIPSSRAGRSRRRRHGRESWPETWLENPRWRPRNGGVGVRALLGFAA